MVKTKKRKKKKRELKTIFDIKEYNTKTRKGDYFYIRHKGKSRLYKMKEGYEDPSLYVQYFNKTTQTKTKRTKRIPVDRFVEYAYKKAIKEKDKKIQAFQTKYKLRFKKYGKLSKAFKSGLTSGTYTFGEIKANQKKIYYDLLSPLVLDKELTDILIKNVQKYKYRFAYLIKLEGINLEDQKKGEIGRISDVNKTLQEIINKYGEHLPKGTIIESKTLEKIKPKIKWKEHAKTMADDGELEKLIFNIVFRKGKK